jgi:hypothetical protein
MSSLGAGMAQAQDTSNQVERKVVKQVVPATRK